MIDNLSIVVYAFTMHMLISLSLDEILLPNYVNWSTAFRDLLLKVEMVSFHLKHELCFIYAYAEANDSCCLLQALWQGFGQV